MKTKKIILMWVLVMILLVTPISSKYTTYTEGDAGSDWYSFDPRVQNWYAVEDWEVEVCRKWGGTPESYNVDNGPTYLSQTTVTLQGEKSEKLPDDTVMYEVGYYIEDAMNRSLEFAVRLKKKDKDEYKRVVAPTNLGKGEANSGYWAEYLTDEYDQVMMGYELKGSDITTIITVPIVDNKGVYVPSSSYGSSGGSGGGLHGGDW